MYINNIFTILDLNIIPENIISHSSKKTSNFDSISFEFKTIITKKSNLISYLFDKIK